MAQWHLCYLPPPLPHNVDQTRHRGGSTAAIQAPRPGPLRRSASQPATRAMAQSRPINPNQAATRTPVFCALQTTARHPGLIGLIGPCRLPACFTPPAELLADVFFAPCRPIARQPRRKLHSYPPLAPPTTVCWLPPLHRLRCRPSLLATLLFTRYGTSCPVPLFPPSTCTLGRPRHTTLVPPPQTASSQPPQAFSSIPRPPLHPPSLPLRPAGLVRYCLVCSSSLQPPISPTWTCSALSIDCLAFTRHLHNHLHPPPRLHNAPGDAFTLTTRLCPPLSTFHTRHCRPSGILNYRRCFHLHRSSFQGFAPLIAPGRALVSSLFSASIHSPPQGPTTSVVTIPALAPSSTLPP
jgi:hypothetical protein